jgi:hypothetical protein
MSPTLAPAVAPKLGPTPILIPVVQTYVLGDFMRAFGIDEETIQTCQYGYANGDFEGVIIRGCTSTGHVMERTQLMFHEVLRDATITLDTSSSVSITEQVSRRLAQSIVTSATTMRRQGLTIQFGYLFSSKGHAAYANTMARYNLVPMTGTAPPGMALRDVYSLTHKPTGASVTHSSARRIG